MEENKEKVSLVENILNEEEDNINISEEVITTISGIAVSEISGVAEMAGGITGGITEVLSGKKNLSKGIKADVAGNNVKIDVNIIVNYGVRIPDVAFDIQNKVKQDRIKSKRSKCSCSRCKCRKNKRRRIRRIK